VAAAVFGVALLLYGSTVAPTVAFWDTGEFIASALTVLLAQDRKSVV